MRDSAVGQLPDPREALVPGVVDLEIQALQLGVALSAESRIARRRLRCRPDKPRRRSPGNWPSTRRPRRSGRKSPASRHRPGRRRVNDARTRSKPVLLTHDRYSLGSRFLARRATAQTVPASTPPGRCPARRREGNPPSRTHPLSNRGPGARYGAGGPSGANGIPLPVPGDMACGAHRSRRGRVNGAPFLQLLLRPRPAEAICPLVTRLASIPSSPSPRQAIAG